MKTTNDTPDELLAFLEQTIADHTAPPTTAESKAQARYPYRNAAINLDIQDGADELMLNQILAMDYDALQQLRDDINTTAALDSSYGQTHICILQCKAMIYRAHELRKLGQYGSPLDLMEGIAYFMGGWILADEFWKRWDNS